MHVCHVWRRFLPSLMWGLERYILELSNFHTLQNSDMRVSLITDRCLVPFSEGCSLPKHQSYGNLNVFRLGPNILSLFRKNLRGKFRFSSELLDNLVTASLLREAANWQKRAEANIFHVHGIWYMDMEYAKIGLSLSRRFNRPLVITLHGDCIGAPPNAMPLRDPQVLKVLKGADAITTYSPLVLSTLHELGFANKSQLVPNLVNVNSFARPANMTESPGNRAIIVSRLDPFKDPLNLVRAFAYVVREIPDATLQIIGNGPLHKQLEMLIRSLSLENSVFLLGRQENVKRFLWNSDVFLTGDAYISILEAWSAGLAVIAIEAETTKNLITDKKNGLVVPPGDPKRLALSILEVMKNEEYRRALAKNGLMSVKEHDIGLVAPKIAHIYESLL